jgi:hypothetical protein
MLPPGARKGDRDKVAAWAAKAALLAGRREILAARVVGHSIKNNDTFSARAADRIRAAAAQARVTAVKAADAERESKATWEQFKIREREMELLQAAASADTAGRPQQAKMEVAQLQLARAFEIAADAETKRVEAWQAAAAAWTEALKKDGKNEAVTLKMKRAAMVAQETAQQLKGSLIGGVIVKSGGDNKQGAEQGLESAKASPEILRLPKDLTSVR